MRTLRILQGPPHTLRAQIATTPSRHLFRHHFATSFATPLATISPPPLSLHVFIRIVRILLVCALLLTPPVFKPRFLMLEMYRFFAVLENLRLKLARLSARILHSAGHRLLLAFISTSSSSSLAEHLASPPSLVYVFPLGRYSLTRT